MAQDLTLKDIVLANQRIPGQSTEEDFLFRLENILAYMDSILSRMENIKAHGGSIVQKTMKPSEIHYPNRDNKKQPPGQSLNIERIIQGLETVKRVKGDITISELIKIIQENRGKLQGLL